jgi:hypothetical protein
MKAFNRLADVTVGRDRTQPISDEQITALVHAEIAVEQLAKVRFYRKNS